jgi:hypothetical protein
MTSFPLLEATRLAIVMCVAPSRKFDAACVQLGGLTKVASPDVVAVPQEYSSCFTWDGQMTLARFTHFP